MGTYISEVYFGLPSPHAYIYTYTQFYLINEKSYAVPLHIWGSSFCKKVILIQKGLQEKPRNEA